MADADDTESWFESALRCVEMAAHQIARMRNPWWNPTWRDLVPGDPPPPARALTAGWGSRGRRSRHAAAARFAKGDAADCSPATPFELGSGSGSGSGSGTGSGASTSGGEEGSSSPEKAAMAGKRRRAGGTADVSGAGGGCETKVSSLTADVSGAGGGCETKVFGIEPPLFFRISAGKDMRRTGKKKTLCELQEEVKLLLGEKNMLQKEMELRRKASEALWAKNQRLKSQQIGFLSERVSLKSATTRASSSTAPSSSSHFFLPDLNEPLSENLN